MQYCDVTASSPSNQDLVQVILYDDERLIKKLPKITLKFVHSDLNSSLLHPSVDVIS